MTIMAAAGVNTMIIMMTTTRPITKTITTDTIERRFHERKNVRSCCSTRVTSELQA
jgi:hypothetical protein